MARYAVATVAELPPGGRKIVQVAGRSIGLFNLGGEYFALRNRCPHAGGPLCEGWLSGIVTSDGPGRYSYARAGEFLRCPWHGWEFDVRTGRSWIDPARLRVKRYPVEVLPGTEFDAEAGETPPQVETYPVQVDSELRLVVEI